jgi:hypothetical protein
MRSSGRPKGHLYSSSVSRVLLNQNLRYIQTLGVRPQSSTAPVSLLVIFLSCTWKVCDSWPKLFVSCFQRLQVNAQIVICLALLLHNLGRPGSVLGPQVGYPDRVSVWFSSSIYPSIITKIGHGRFHLHSSLFFTYNHRLDNLCYEELPLSNKEQKLLSVTAVLTLKLCIFLADQLIQRY